MKSETYILGLICFSMAAWVQETQLLMKCQENTAAVQESLPEYLRLDPSLTAFQQGICTVNKQHYSQCQCQ